MMLLYPTHPSFGPVRWRRETQSNTRAVETGRELVTREIVAAPAQTGEDLVLQDTPSFEQAAERVFTELLAEESRDRSFLEAFSGALLPAYRLVEELADLVGVPDLDADPDGDVAIDWFLKDNARLAASVASSGSVSFALVTRRAGSVKGTVPSVSRASVAIKSALVDTGLVSS